MLAVCQSGHWCGRCSSSAAGPPHAIKHHAKLANVRCGIPAEHFPPTFYTFCALRLACTRSACTVPAAVAMFSSLYQNLPTAAAMLPSAGRKADGETTALTAARKTAAAYSSEVHDA